MKTSLYLFFSGLLILGTVTSCDKVKQPVVDYEDFDISLYPGNFNDYEYPTFEENTNTLRNVLIEDYTGHQCGACPAAALVAKDLEDSNPGRVFIASIHAGPSNNGITGFQKTNDVYTTDFTNPEGLQMASTFFQNNYGLIANPRGSANRIADDGGKFLFAQSAWGEITTAALTSELSINLQAKSSYFPETNGVFLHVETEFLKNLSGKYHIVVYAIQNEVIAPQLVDADKDDNYHHHNVHLGNLYDETWGRSVGNGSIAAGTKVVTDFSYKLPDGITREEMHFQIFVFDRDSYEIMQVIEHKF